MSLPEHRLVLFTGSREWDDFDLVKGIFNHLNASLDTIVQGGAGGLDGMASVLAATLGHHVYTLKAPWGQFGKAAGPLRNEHMARLLPDYTYAFPLPASKGTWDMIRRIQARGLPGQYWTPDGWETW